MSETVIKLETVHPADFFGYNNTRLELIRKAFNKLKIVARGNKITALGHEDELKIFEGKMNTIIQLFEKTGKITDIQLEAILEGKKDATFHSSKEAVLVYGNAGKQIRAKTANQKKLVKLSDTNDVVFAIGPAGTGKTYTAVALAVRGLKNKYVQKIILTRPAVEAGESLGFLPGDLQEKVDPYLRPLYDALDDMIPTDKLNYFMANRIIEVAPLAYMRGRTLDNAFIILDEAQNATQAQLKMFLTRIGPHAKCIITGDLSQIDLPKNQQSGLKKTTEILNDIDGIGVIHLSKDDVIRHRLVKEIIDAFEKEEQAEAAKNNFKTKKKVNP